jgi:AraC family transcriptional activator of tynA and feaB
MRLRAAVCSLIALAAFFRSTHVGVRFEAQPVRRWSTDEVDQRQALAYWVDTVCDCLLELDIDTPLREHFRARLAQTDLGAATASFLQAERQRVHRTRAKIAHSRYSIFFLLQLRAGQMRLQQLGREAFMRQGDCVLIDGTEPYEIDCPEPTSALALRLPEDWLKSWVPHPECLSARRFTGVGWSAALSAALGSLDVDSCHQLALPGGVVADQIAALLSLTAGSGSAANRRPSLYEDFVTSLRERLHEADLTPLAVAADHGVSIRSLHYAFARAGSTFVEQLMRLRLERACVILCDVRQSDLSVGEIAARCGFTDPSHFARRFRQRFGQAPLQFRHSNVPTDRSITSSRPAG